MDYLSAFRSLKTNNKYARKSPHKAILLLSVIEMFENKLLSDNVINYDDYLLETFQTVWNRVLPSETTFFTTVYFPFWYMQSEGFWLNIPKRGKEDMFRDYWENRIKPTESRIKELIQYAVLEDGLYFMMTTSSGRSALKRALLEEYTDFSEREVERMCVVKEDIVIDNSLKAIETYQSLFDEKQTASSIKITNEIDSSLHDLSDNIQIALNYEYYSFLKSHLTEREIFKEVFPSVEDLVYRLINNPYKKGELNHSFSFIYENFLADLRVSLMSEDDSMFIIEKINSALDLLQEVTFNNNIIAPSNTIKSNILEIQNVQIETKEDRLKELFFRFSSEEKRNGKPWTNEEEEFISLCYEKGWSCDRIGEIVGRTPVAIYMRLTDKLGYIIEDVPAGVQSVIPIVSSETSQSSNIRDYRIENINNKCYIFNSQNECVFSTIGYLKIIGDKAYRFNYKEGFFTIKAIDYFNNRWLKGKKLLVATSHSDLYLKIKRYGFSLDNVENFIESHQMHLNQIKFLGEWYGFDGNRLD
jgi:hypothetical protein